MQLHFGGVCVMQFTTHFTKPVIKAGAASSLGKSLLSQDDGVSLPRIAAH